MSYHDLFQNIHRQIQSKTKQNWDTTWFSSRKLTRFGYIICHACSRNLFEETNTTRKHTIYKSKITNNMHCQTQQPKNHYLSLELEDENRIKLALRTMMLMVQGVQLDNHQMNTELCALPLKKRPIDDSTVAPPFKKQRIATTDAILDQAADEVWEVSNWERILENWNPEQENLPFSSLDSALVEADPIITRHS